MSKKQDFSSLIKKATNTTSNTPKQKVVPVADKFNTDEVQFSFYIKKEMLKRLKIKATIEETSIKSLINHYIEKGLQENEK